MNPWIVLAGLIIVAAVFVVLPVTAAVYGYWSGRRCVRCPVTGRDAVIEVDPRLAALGAVVGARRVRLTACSLLPERIWCARACLREPTGA
jgi:hypothetical protein